MKRDPQTPAGRRAREGFLSHDHLRAGAQIDGFGVGTKMGVSADTPYSDMAYKLVEYDGRPVLKLSSGKKTLICEKQVYRTRAGDALEGDIIALREETDSSGGALLQPVMRGGKRLAKPESLTAARERLKDELAALPPAYKRVRSPDEYPVVRPSLSAVWSFGFSSSILPQNRQTRPQGKGC